MNGVWIQRAARAGLATAALLVSGLAGLALALEARGATLQVTVGPLTIVSSKATGNVSGLPAGIAVSIDGQPYTASSSGTVALALSQLDGDSALTIAFTDAGGVARTASAPLVDSVSGETLTPAQIADPIPNVSRQVDLSVEVSDGSTSTATSTSSTSTSTTTGGGGGGGGGTTTTTPSTTTPPPTTGGGSGGLPAGAVTLPGGSVSIPVSSVSAPRRLVVKRVVFTPKAMSSRRRTVLARVEIRDSRGYVVRGAVVTVASRKAGQLRPVSRRTTTLKGVTTFRLSGRPAAWSRPGTRLVLKVRAARPGIPAVASPTRLATLRVVRAR